MLAAILSLIGEHPIDGMPWRLVSRSELWSFLVELLPTAILPKPRPDSLGDLDRQQTYSPKPPSSLAYHVVCSPDQEAQWSHTLHLSVCHRVSMLPCRKSSDRSRQVVLPGADVTAWMVVSSHAMTVVTIETSGMLFPPRQQSNASHYHSLHPFT
ncbi:hypothetical protein LZ30DRAFT_106534 [Colletotrichum cereale]|nr:hypothetical protein LZ30DRAFT_106534 [Colletotrichum cereale]